MADSLIGRSRASEVHRATARNFVRSILCCLLFSAVFCSLNAEELLDPTRPPEIVALPKQGEMGATPNQPARLRSIIISKIRRAAIIENETVELGGKYGDARLIEVNESGVVLEGEQGKQVLMLFPDVRITSMQESMTKSLSAESGVQAGSQKGKSVTP